MSEQDNSDTGGSAEAATQGEPAGAPLGPNGEKALGAEREARKAAEKAVKELQDRLDAVEQETVVAREASVAAAAESEQKIGSLTTDTARYRVALTKGLPEELVGFLTGTTEDEISGQADVLASRLNVPTSLRPDLTQGGAGDPAPQTTRDQFAAAVGDFLN